MVIELLLMIFLIEAGLKAFGFYLTYFNDRCVNSARSVVRAGSGSQARGGRAAPIGVHAPFCPLLTAGGRSVNLNAAASASPGRRLLPVLSVRSPRSTYQRRRSWPTFASGGFLLAAWDRGRCQTRNARRDVQAQTWKQTAAPECNSR